MGSVVELKKRWVKISVMTTFATLIVFLHISLHNLTRLQTDGDPDRYYHYAISKIYAESGPPKILPQAEDVGWGKAFPEKEFLFHIITGLGYKFGGDPGVDVAVLVVSVATMLSLYLIACTFTTPGIAALSTVLVSAAGVYRFYQRLHMVRPHVLAIFGFTWILYAATTRRPRLLLATCLLFALSYHGLQVPLVVLAMIMIAGFLARQPSTGLVLFGMAGLMMGVLANPYFPYNITVMIQHLQIALGHSQISETHFGRELYPLRSDDYLKNAAMFIALGVVAFGFMMRHLWPPRGIRQGNDKLEAYQFFLIAGVFAAFLLASMKSPRAFEYVAPSALMLMCLLSRQKKLWRWSAAVFLIPACMQLFPFAKKIAVSRSQVAETDESSYKTMHDALSALPPSSLGKKILNCKWDRSPYIFYDRPDLRFTGLLDPTFLLVGNSELHTRLEELNRGDVADPFGLVRDFFKADYVICDLPEVNDLLLRDPNFRLIYPSRRDDLAASWVFEVAREQVPQSVRQFRTYIFRESNDRADWLKEPASNLKFADWPPTDWQDYANKPTFVNLRSLTNINQSDEEQKSQSGQSKNASKSVVSDQTRSSAKIFCAQVEPENAEIRRLAGADVVGVGGGPAVRLWRNGRLILESRKKLEIAHLVNLMVKLEPPLSDRDHLQIVVCSDQEGPVGLALSLWRTQDLRELCTQKLNPAVFAQHTEDRSVASNNSSTNCLGPFAETESLL